jgi:hypothetical protein
VPADAALHDVAVQVVLEAQVLVDGEPVGGHLFAFTVGAAAAEVSTTVGVEQVACGVECEGFQVPARGGRSAGSVFLGGKDAAQGVVAVLAVAAQAVARGDEVACGVVLVQAGDALAGGQGVSRSHRAWGEGLPGWPWSAPCWLTLWEVRRPMGSQP